MEDRLPPLRLVGGLCLLDGTMHAHSVGLAHGHFTQGPSTEIDATGHLILPGIVDLRSSAWRGHMPKAAPKAANVAKAHLEASQALARAGITTAWISASWRRADALGTPEMTTALLDAIENVRAEIGIEAVPRLEVDTHLTGQTDRLIAVIRRHDVRHVGLHPVLAELQAVAESLTEARAKWIGNHGVTEAGLSGAIAQATATRHSVPRHLCRLTEALDALDVTYSSRGDADPEAREFYRMIGARMADAPKTRAAAATAKAMQDPVLAEAHDVIASARLQHWVADGLIDALVTGAAPSSALRAVLALEARGIMPLAQAWRLISENPARILHQSDRGVILPGHRADLVVLEAETRHVAATMSGGRLVHGTGPLATRLMQLAANPLAAE